ncbi:hypothetical protein VDG1235_2201 [Verrucomicrobiia bacterium DG1235]|nr:hypothetical protein VDG1235_2201 [Verrucomicrobiae bacterium DG1235]
MKYPTFPRVVAALFLCKVLACSLAAEWKESETSIGWLSEEGEVIWEFVWDAAAGKPYFHPLRVPGGPELTKLRPEDHAWHYGMWFSWKLINEVNYWEENGGKAEGATRWSDPKIEKTEDGGVVIRLRIDYVHPSGRIDLKEYRDLVISKVERNGKYTIDWTSHFTAGSEGAYLDRTPLPNEPGGKLWGGYGGLSVRLAHGEDPVSFVTEGGPLEDFVDNRSRPRTPAVGVTVFPKERNSGSLAMLSDPRNMIGDQSWYLINGQPSRFACAAVLVPGPKQLDAGEVWELSYRLVVRPKAWDAEDLETEMIRWLRR